MKILIMGATNRDFLVSCKKPPNQRQYISLLKKLCKLCGCRWDDFRHCYAEVWEDDELPRTFPVIEIAVDFPTKYRADILPPHNKR